MIPDRAAGDVRNYETLCFLRPYVHITKRYIISLATARDGRPSWNHCMYESQSLIQAVAGKRGSGFRLCEASCKVGDRIDKTRSKVRALPFRGNFDVSC